MNYWVRGGGGEQKAGGEARGREGPALNGVPQPEKLGGLKEKNPPIEKCIRGGGPKTKEEVSAPRGEEGEIQNAPLYRKMKKTH